jgi:hypothetical protein
MPPDGLIGLMKNRPGFQDGFDVSKYLFHLPELLVFESNHVGRELRIGAENPFAVISGFLLDLRLIDGDIIPVQLEVFTVWPVIIKGETTLLHRRKGMSPFDGQEEAKIGLTVYREK